MPSFFPSETMLWATIIVSLLLLHSSPAKHYTGEAAEVAAASGSVLAMYVFGDSLVDVGNNNHLPLSVLKANFPHNGVDFPGRKPTGRFSNGKNAADFLAEKVGLSSSPSPYLSQTLNPNKFDAYVSGVNFASGGAGILDGTNNNLQCITMNKQIEYFSAVRGVISQKLGSVEAQKHLSRSLFLVVIGSNDILGFVKSSQKGNPQQFVDSLISVLGTQLKNLYNLGARKLAFVGTGAIGCCPSQRSQNKTGDCNVETNFVSLKYNQGVVSLLDKMKSQFPDMAYSFYDTHSALLEFTQKAAQYGFTEVKAACCGLGNLNAKVACLPLATYCSNRRDHMFWDFYHPTEALSSLLIGEAFEGTNSRTYPNTIQQLIAA